MIHRYDEIVARPEIPFLNDRGVPGILQRGGNPGRPALVFTAVGDKEVTLPGSAQPVTSAWPADGVTELYPGMGVVIHRGRSTGRRYQTQVNAFRTEGGFIFALTRT